MKAESSHLPGRPVYIVDGARTPFLKVRGEPGPFRASDLAHAAGQALLHRLPVEPAQVDQVVLGCVSSGPDESNIARVVALRLGCGDRVPAMTVQRNCASGLQALDTAALDIASGRSDLVLAGGTEAMSHFGVLLSQSMVAWLALWNRARSLPARGRALMQLRLRYLKPVVGLLRGLTDPVVGLSMGQTAEQLAAELGIAREQMDAFALESHRRLAQAVDEGYLDEIVPLYDAAGNVYQQDTGLRRDVSLDALARLRPVFDRPVGAVTAGNSAQVTDGAAMLLLASEDALMRYGLSVRGRLVDVQWSGLAPERMGLGPVMAMAPLLGRQGLTSRDVDAWEINEAFAAQVLACLAAWQSPAFCRQYLGRDEAFAAIPMKRLNSDGGAISIGHPVGASGARIVLHLLRVLERHEGRRGVASICIGGGQGGAALVERGEA